MRELTPDAARRASRGMPWRGASPRALKCAFLLGVVALYAVAIAILDGLDFEPVKDEEQFWALSQAFAASWPPGLDQLRSYDEPMTPGAFLAWAALERTLHRGLPAARLLTVAASLAVLALIAWRPAPRREPSAAPVLAALGLLLYPYWLPISVLVYTDVPASLCVVCGLFLYVRNRHAAAAFLFVVAIATRQYAVTFPAAILAHEGLAALRARTPSPSRWLPYALAVASLGGWVVFFGGLSPAPSLEKWPRHASALASIQPAYALYALAALGAYFVAPEFLLFRRWRALRLRLDARLAAVLIVAVACFALFTPYYPRQIGLLNRGLHALFGDGDLAQGVRTGLLLVLVCAAVARFARPGIGTWVVAANVAIMPFVWSPWEKYYMPTLAALWFLAAAGALDDPASGEARPPDPPRPALTPPGRTAPW